MHDAVTYDAVDNEGWTLVRCDQCGYESRVQLIAKGRGYYSGREYAALHQLAGEKVLCDECAPNDG